MNDISLEPRLEELKKEFKKFKENKMLELAQPKIVNLNNNRG